MVNHSGQNSLPEKTYLGRRAALLAQTHSIIMTSSRFVLCDMYFGCCLQGMRHLWPDPLHPPPLWHPFLSILYMFSTEILYFWMSWQRLQKCLLMVGLLKAWAHLGSRLDGLPSLISRCHLRKPWIHFSPGFVPQRAWAFIQIECLLSGWKVSDRKMIQSMRAFFASGERSCWLEWASHGERDIWRKWQQTVS